MGALHHAAHATGVAVVVLLVLLCALGALLRAATRKDAEDAERKEARHARHAERRRLAAERSGIGEYGAADDRDAIDEAAVTAAPPLAAGVDPEEAAALENFHAFQSMSFSAVEPAAAAAAGSFAADGSFAGGAASHGRPRRHVSFPDAAPSSSAAMFPPGTTPLGRRS